MSYVKHLRGKSAMGCRSIQAERFTGDFEPAGRKIEGDAMKANAGAANDVEQVVRIILAEGFSPYDRDDLLVIEGWQRQTSIAYVSTQSSAALGDITGVEFRCSHGAKEMWLGSLRIATPFRLTGLGRQLVGVAETIAREIGMGVINVFPLMSSRLFWEKMGYGPHPHTSRVMRKIVNANRRSGTWAH